MANNRGRRPTPQTNSKPYEPTEDKLQAAPKKFYYELWMFREALSLLRAKPRNDVVRNISLEATLVHARNLLDFFTGRPSSEDDIRAAHFLPKSRRTERGNWWTSSKLEELQRHMDEINKSFSRLMYTRGDEKPGWDLPQIGKEIEAAYKEFRSLLAEADRGAWLP